MAPHGDAIEVLRWLRWAGAMQRVSAGALWLGGALVLGLACRLAWTPAVFTRDGLLNGAVFWALVVAVALAASGVVGSLSLRSRAFGMLSHLSPAEALEPLIRCAQSGDPVNRYAASLSMVEVLRRTPRTQLTAMDDVSRRHLRRVLLDSSFEDLTEVQTTALETLRSCGDSRDAAAARCLGESRATDPEKIRVRRLAMDVARAIDARQLAESRQGVLLRPAAPPVAPEMLLLRAPNIAGDLPEEMLVRPAEEPDAEGTARFDAQGASSGSSTCLT